MGETIASRKAKPASKIEQQKHNLQLEKGAELGRFYLGSTAVVLFEPNKIQWIESLVADSTVVMGGKMGAVV